MKTPILTIFLSIMVLSVISCKKDPKSDKLEVVEEVVQDSTIVIAEEVVEEKKPVVKKKKKTTKKKSTTKDKTLRIPGTFDSTDNSYVKKYVRDYERYVSNYKKAVESNDMDSFLKLSDASSDLTRQYSRLMNILPGEEITKLSEYMQVKSEQLAKLSDSM
ncbi:hypothetical protein [Aquimarina sediminis]|uniref:hypothetical protein n=1 Tax=Aquimarina sediminis TaxID=2070536 RepID=UPI000CA04BDA|nr:hypothetical protein [Aquimarina sediminis]